MKLVFIALVVFFSIQQDYRFTLSSNCFVLNDKPATVTTKEDLQTTSKPTAHTHYHEVASAPYQACHSSTLLNCQ